jgi:hypothetical protein
MERLGEDSRGVESVPSGVPGRMRPRSHWFFAPVARNGGDQASRLVRSRFDGGVQAFADYRAVGDSLIGVIESEPFGVSLDGQYRFDSVFEAFLSGHYFLFDKWRDLVSEHLAAGLRYVAYIGSPIRGRGRTSDEVIDMVDEFMVRSVPGVEIGLDAASPEGFDSLTYDFARRLQDRGVKVWIESLPLVEADHWDGFGWLALDRELRAMLQRGQRLRPFHKAREVVICYTRHETGSTIEGDAQLAKALEGYPVEIGKAWHPWDHSRFVELLSE